jgi:hypothetical protein
MGHRYRALLRERRWWIAGAAIWSVAFTVSAYFLWLEVDDPEAAFNRVQIGMTIGEADAAVGREAVWQFAFGSHSEKAYAFGEYGVSVGFDSNGKVVGKERLGGIRRDQFQPSARERFWDLVDFIRDCVRLLIRRG